MRELPLPGGVHLPSPTGPESQGIVARVPVFKDKTGRSFPKFADGMKANYLPVETLLARPFDSDAHYAAYSVSFFPRRLGAAAVGHPELSAGIPMVLYAWDADDPEAHRTKTPAREEWRREERQKIDRLLKLHPRAVVHETRGGYRGLSLLKTPFLIRTKEDQSAWRLFYFQQLCYLYRTFGIIADPTCSDFTRLFRAPHATRYPEQGPEDWPLHGDAHSLGVWEYVPEEKDFEADRRAAEQLAKPDDPKNLWNRVLKTLSPPPTKERREEGKEDTPTSLKSSEKTRPFRSVPGGALPYPQLSPYLSAALSGEAEDLAFACTGSRNDRLNVAAYNLGQLPDLPEDFVYRELRSACEMNGYLADDGDAAFEASFQSGFQAGRARPRQRPPRKPKLKASFKAVNAPLVAYQGGASPDIQPNDKERPEIEVTPDVHLVVDAAVSALGSDEQLFQKAERLVTVRCGEAPKGWDRDKAAPAIRTLSTANLLERLTRAARFVKYDQRTESLKHTVPSDRVVKAVEERGTWKGIRPLTGVLTTPFLRPDGTVCQEAGYDETTGYLLLPNAAYPKVPEHPTKEQAKHALAELEEVVCDFPFVDELHKAGWLAFVLTLLARPAIRGCTPGFGFDASLRGSGKSKLVDAAALLVFGCRATRTVQSDDEAETRKRVTSILMEGDPLALIDNVETPLGGPTLDALLTSELWKDRLLGQNKTTGALPALTVWAATGNNLTFTGDAVRRFLHVRLEPQSDLPEERQNFKHPDLLGWIQEVRPRLVTAALTILRAFFLAEDKPKNSPTWGSYESWAALIPPCFVWLGKPDPLALHRELAKTQDQNKNALLGFLLEMEDWLAREKKSAAAAKEILKAAYGGMYDPDLDGLRESIEDLCPMPRGAQPTPKSLGKQLGRHNGRWVADSASQEGRLLRLKNTPDRNGVACWRIEQKPDELLTPKPPKASQDEARGLRGLRGLSQTNVGNSQKERSGSFTAFLGERSQEEPANPANPALHIESDLSPQPPAPPGSLKESERREKEEKRAPGSLIGRPVATPKEKAPSAPKVPSLFETQGSEPLRGFASLSSYQRKRAERKSQELKRQGVPDDEADKQADLWAQTLPKTSTEVDL